MIEDNRQSRDLCVQCRRDGELSAGRREEFPPQCRSRIPLPHIGLFILPLCGVPQKGLPNSEGGIFMQKRDLTAFRTPFSATYWRFAVADSKDLRIMVFAAMMIAACSALAQIPSIPTTDPNVRVTWGFLARAVCGMVGGPVTALIFGFAEDTINFFIHPTGPYFPGYALTTMLGTMIYALFLYRVKFTPVTLAVRVFLAKLCTNILNVTLGALWSAILYSKGYIYYMVKSFWKNLVMLPVQTVMLCFLLAALIPILGRVGLIPRSGFRFEQKKKTAENREPWEN